MRIDDSEYRLKSEEFGFFIFAWLPKRCRNGKIRWLCSVERHGVPGHYTYTKGNRAH